LRLPAGKANPILSNLSLKNLPPFLDLALKKKTKKKRSIIELATDQQSLHPSPSHRQHAWRTSKKDKKAIY